MRLRPVGAVLGTRRFSFHTREDRCCERCAVALDHRLEASPSRAAVTAILCRPMPPLRTTASPILTLAGPTGPGARMRSIPGVDSLTGRLVHTLIGYTDRPTAAQIVVYLLTIATIVGLMRFQRSRTLAISAKRSSAEIASEHGVGIRPPRSARATVTN
jgi:hypothetical protein